MLILRLELNRLTARVAALVLVVTVLSASAQAAGLTQREADGYLQWLHSLEQLIASQEASELPEDRLLFPFDTQRVVSDEPAPYKHLALARAMNDLERKYRSGAMPPITSAFHGLSMARNYFSLSEYDSALVWYERVARLDSTAQYTGEIRQQLLATAVALGDSLAVVRHLQQLIADDALAVRESELVVAFRFLIVRNDRHNLDLLLRAVEPQTSRLSPRVRYWLAYASFSRQRHQPALTELRQLITAGGLSLELDRHQRCWVLQAIPDLLCLTGEARAGRQLYDLLAASAVAELRDWADYQRATLDFLAHNYLRAGTIFKRLCESGETDVWRDGACEMAALARELTRTETEGEPYGTAGFFQR